LKPVLHSLLPIVVYCLLPKVLHSCLLKTLHFCLPTTKATIVLSGSLVEALLTYYLERKKIKTLTILLENKQTKNIKLYDAVLSDLLNFIQEQKYFGNDFHHLGSMSRVYRNFIHPGLELRSKESIESKAQLCFLSTLEIIKRVIN
jgi:hypothetical protein